MVYNKDEKSHFETLERIFERLQENGLAIKLSKCEFGKKTVEYLGYQVSKDGIKPLNRKISALVDFPTPKTQKELLHYLGALNYFRSSLKGVKTGTKYENPAEVMQVLFNIATCKMPSKKFVEIWNQDARIDKAFQKSRSVERSISYIVKIQKLLRYPFFY